MKKSCEHFGEFIGLKYRRNKKTSWEMLGQRETSQKALVDNLCVQEARKLKKKFEQGLPVA